ncbi:MAG: antibiotic biosynthesis monooxygenase [Chloroflexi bacterium]|nr:antibiotic biosynthesis monooxygenase [Chloroflexota bacterium]MBI4197912.1 antibiotic biosynthesis monooxygenase [Chloroflexota bacterium]
MITVLVHHYVIPQMTKQAEALIKENGRVMRSFPGFVSRQTLYAQNDPNQITTVTVWRSIEAYQGWTNRPDRPQPQPNAPAMWSKPIENTLFNVTAEV